MSGASAANEAGAAARPGPAPPQSAAAAAAGSEAAQGRATPVAARAAAGAAALPEEAGRPHRRPLPPLQALPPLEAARCAAWIERRLARAALAEQLPLWGAEIELPAEALERACAWARAVQGAPGAVLLGADPGLACELIATGLAPLLVAPSAGALGWVHVLARRAHDAACRRAAALAAELAARRRAASWWAGPSAPEATASAGAERAREAGPPQPATAAPLPPAPPLLGAGAVALPLRDGALGWLCAADVLPHLPDWQAAVREWARVLRPGGRLVLASLSERDPDAPGFFSALGRVLWPEALAGFPRSQDLTWLLHSERLRVESASVVRLRMQWERIEKLESEPGAARAFAEQASESLRALYEIDREGMTWRYLMLSARRLGAD